MNIKSWAAEAYNIQNPQYVQIILHYYQLFIKVQKNTFLTRYSDSHQYYSIKKSVALSNYWTVGTEWYTVCIFYCIKPAVITQTV